MNQAQHNAYPNNKATDGAWPPAFAENKFYDATSSICWDTSSKKYKLSRTGGVKMMAHDHDNINNYWNGNLDREGVNNYWDL